MCRRSATYRPLKTLAVLGATAFFLVACGGGGGNGKPTPPDPTPPGNGEQQMRITPLREYGSIAYGIRAAAGSEGGRSTQVTITTTSTGTSRSAARDTALAKCRTGCGTESACRSSCREVLRFRNACGASASGGGSDAGYLFDGVGWGASESVAERNAIAACNRAASTKEGASGNESCKIIDDVGNAFCAKAGSATPSGEASTIAAASHWTPGSTPTPTSGPGSAPTPTSGNSYGSIAIAISGSSWGDGSFGSGNSQSSARNDALARCRQVASSSSNCQEVLWFQNACGSTAISEDNSRIGVGWDESESEAGSKAIAACRTAGGQGCRVRTSTAGAPSTFCAKSGSAAPTGQASPVPPRPTSTTREEPEPTREEPEPETRTPTQTDSRSITFTFVDACNDGRRVNIRFFEAVAGRNTGHQWPGGRQFWSTTGYNRTNSQPLACRSGTQVCYGAQIDGTRTYFGAGFDGNESCSACCYTCGGGDPRTLRFGCPS